MYLQNGLIQKESFLSQNTHLLHDNIPELYTKFGGIFFPMSVKYY